MSDSPDIFVVMYRDCERMYTVSLSDHSNLAAARQWIKKRVRKGMYFSKELEIHARPPRFGEGPYGN